MVELFHAISVILQPQRTYIFKNIIFEEASKFCQIIDEKKTKCKQCQKIFFQKTTCIRHIKEDHLGINVKEGCQENCQM